MIAVLIALLVFAVAAGVTHTVTIGYSGAGVNDTRAVEYTGTGFSGVQETIAAGTDTEVEFTLDVSALVTCYLYSTTACTIEWNDSSGSQGSISLAAGEPLVYTGANSGANPWGSTDVTSIFVTNAAETVLTIVALVDATP